MDGSQGRGWQERKWKNYNFPYERKGGVNRVVDLIPVEKDLEIHTITILEARKWVRIRSRMRISNWLWCRQIREVRFNVGVCVVVLCI